MPETDDAQPQAQKPAAASFLQEGVRLALPNCQFCMNLSKKLSCDARLMKKGFAPFAICRSKGCAWANKNP
jgi:hypothetical protein